MTELARRDKDALNLSKLQAIIIKQIDGASINQIKLWLEQVDGVWDSLERSNKALMQRAGASEIKQYEEDFERFSVIYKEIKGILNESLDQLTDQLSHPSPEQLRQESHERALARIARYVDEHHAELVPGEIEFQRNSLAALYEQLQAVRLERIIKGESEDVVIQDEDNDSATYMRTMHLLATAVAQPTNNASADIVANQPGQRDLIQIPTIQITPFDGSLDMWETFRDCFEHSIHKRANMSAVHKLQYLKSLVKGNAEELLRNFALTNDNYASAWKLLNDRYNNVRELVWAHMRAIATQPKCSESADDLRRLMNRTASAALALANLGRVTNGAAGDWIVFHAIEKLDIDTRRMWEQKITVDDAIPTWPQLEEFLNGRVRSLSAIGRIKPISSVKPHAKPGRSMQSNQASVESTSFANNLQTQQIGTRYTCPCCEGHHLIQFCEAFRKLSIDARRGLIAAKGLCFVCMGAGHQAGVCRVKRSCTTCNRRHSTLLHLPSSENQPQAPVTAAIAQSANAVAVNPACAQVILATAIVYVQDTDGGLHPLRALLDQGSQVSFVSEEAAQLLRLPRRAVNVNVVGIGGVAAGNANHSVALNLHSRFNQACVTSVNALVIRQLSNLANIVVNKTCEWPHIKGLQLADPEFTRQRKVDILIGGDIYGEILLPGLRQRAGLPTAQNTVLGWVLSGRLPIDNTSNRATIMSNHCNVENELTRFWEIEETSSKRALTVEEEKCEQHYESTVTRDNNGRLHVRLPLRSLNATFGESQHIAITRQLQLEKRFAASDEFATTYREFMLQYEQLGHMSVVDDAKVDMGKLRANMSANTREYYIPHHAVLKEASTSTKLRVVFDASRKSSNGLSLNDNMLIGPRLQDNLTAIVMRWRRHRIGFCADIEKMYRQIVVDQPDADMQRIVWRPTANESMKVYRLTTVTYGTASAPYLAVKSLQTLANLERERFPQGAEVAMNCFYVDDVLAGADSIADCLETQRQIIQLLASGGFVLRKWVSNCEDILAQVPADHRERQLPLTIDESTSVKTLGIQWNPSSDELCFNISAPETNDIHTKRSFLSQAARLYDPLGWLAPSTVVVKILFQQLWKENLGWDDPLPTTIANQWNQLQRSLCCFQTLRIPRWVSMANTRSVEIHGFCDASMAAYASVVFVRVTTEDGNVNVHNVSAKTKVAPLKVISLPRLELCGAVLLVKLLQDIKSAMYFNDNISITCWTDSTIVLAWLRADPARFNVFVANRVSEIQRNVPCALWRHVRSEDNPADCASRGISPQNLIAHSLWWSGPHWLRDTRENWPQLIVTDNPSEELRTNSNAAITVQPKYQWDLITKVSSWKRLTRITALCKRFVNNCRAAIADRLLGPLTVAEFRDAHEFWVKDAQGAVFSGELRCLRTDSTISRSSSLISLNPVLSSTKVLRVGGRLANASSIPDETKTPAIIPRRCPLSALLVSDAHEQTLHGGPSLMLTFLRRSYWIIDGQKEANQFVKRCVTCFRFKARPTTQQMAALPAARVEPSRPFQHTALDYSGAVMVRTAKGRGHHATKAYFCVFVCLATKAVHIELASDLTTVAFIAAYERFVARRGLCTDIYSDNATNFVGASAVFLRSERKLFDAQIQTTLANRGTTWHFSPPLSPHFNGLAESAIRSVKHHLRRVIGDSTLTYEEMTTVLNKVEACLNSRPLHPISNDPNDLDVLTPAHFLIGEPIVTIPECSVMNQQPSLLTRWKLTQQMVQRFWARWSTDYLHTLQQRRKWQQRERNLRIGDLVLVLDDNQPPTKWAIGRIIDTHPGNDHQVRVVTIRTKNATYKRSIVKVARLPLEDEHTEETSSSV